MEIKNLIQQCHSVNKIIETKSDGLSGKTTMTSVLLEMSPYAFANEMRNKISDDYVIIARSNELDIAYILNGVEDLFYFMQMNNGFDPQLLVKDCVDCIRKVVRFLNENETVLEYHDYFNLTVDEIKGLCTDADRYFSSAEPIELPYDEF